MDEVGCVNIFLSAGAGVAEVVAELEAAGLEVPIDPFGHVQLDKVNPGAWFGKQFAQPRRSGSPCGNCPESAKG